MLICFGICWRAHFVTVFVGSKWQNLHCHRLVAKQRIPKLCVQVFIALIECLQTPNISNFNFQFSVFPLFLLFLFFGSHNLEIICSNYGFRLRNSSISLWLKMTNIGLVWSHRQFASFVSFKNMLNIIGRTSLTLWAMFYKNPKTCCWRPSKRCTNLNCALLFLNCYISLYLLKRNAYCTKWWWWSRSR